MSSDTGLCPTTAPGPPAGTSHRTVEPPARLLGRRPALDGVRAVAILAVMTAHLYPAETRVGAVAMDLFFGLSGFLITALLLGERATTGRISLSKFFGRRALRLFPALWVFLGLWLAVVYVFHGAPWLSTIPGRSHPVPIRLPVEVEGVGAAVGYVINWMYAFGLFPGAVPIPHLWSLAVEEQFYLFWAPLLALSVANQRRRRLLVPATILLVVGSLADSLRLELWPDRGDPLRVYVGTDTRAAVFLVGALLAMAFTSGVLERLAHGWVGQVLPWAGAGGLVVAVLFQRARGVVTFWLLGWVLPAIAGPLLVAAVVARRDHLLARLARARWLTYVGRRSYALYLWHYVWATWTATIGPVRYPIVIGASFACAELSWRLVERPAQRERQRLTPDGRLPPGVARPAPDGPPGAPESRPVDRAVVAAGDRRVLSRLPGPALPVALARAVPVGYAPRPSWSTASRDRDGREARDVGPSSRRPDDAAAAERLGHRAGPGAPRSILSRARAVAGPSTGPAGRRLARRRRAGATGRRRSLRRPGPW